MILISFVLIGLLGFLRILIRRANYEEEIPQTAAGKIRRFVADAIGLISSDLREWVIGQDPETAFYRRLTEILEKQDHVRKPEQTHREFANEVSLEYEKHASGSLIANVVSEATEAFNRVRFGQIQLEEDEQQRIGRQLDDLDRLLSTNPAT